MKALFSAVAVLLTAIAFSSYIRGIFANQIKPHVFSWIIWGTTTFVVFLAQLQGGGGIGAWPIGISGLITLWIAVLAYQRKADSHIRRVDWLFFLSAMAALPVWYFTDNPLWAVVILTTVDLLGFGPTLRKAYALPFDEDLPFFALFLLRNLLVVAALESYSWVTALFPAAIAAACAVVMLIVVWRRRCLSR